MAKMYPPMTMNPELSLTVASIGAPQGASTPCGVFFHVFLTFPLKISLIRVKF